MHDPHRFVSYYESQVGGALPGFAGSPVMYGRGIGSVFSKLFRFISPLVRKGFAIAKPHLKNVAKNIASDVVSQAVGRMSGASGSGVQEGSGGMMVLARRPRKRPPGQRVTTGKKRRRGEKKSVDRSLTKRRITAKTLSDIF